MKHVRHEMYLHTLQTRRVTYVKFRHFKSKRRNVTTVQAGEVCFSAFDNKRYILPELCGVHTANVFSSKEMQKEVLQTLYYLQYQCS